MLILSNIKNLYDGCSAEDSSVHHNCDLFVEKGKVFDLKPHNSDLPVGSEHQRVDCRSFTVTPGLIDCHGHITIHGMRDQDHELMNSQDQLLYVEKILHTTLVDGGVTTMRDVGGATNRMKQLVEDGVMIGPRLKIAICMLSTTGGHADFRGPDRCHATLTKLWPEAPGRPSSIVDSPWSCRKRVREIAACGADLIKLCTSPGVTSPGDKLEHEDFSGEEIAAICDEAEKRGLRVAAHAHSKSGIELAIKHGVHDLQHISFMDERLAEMAYENQCTVTPTSWVTKALMDSEDFNPFVVEKIKQVNKVHGQAVKFAFNAGMKMLAGTDPVVQGMHGKNYMELVSLVGDGVPPLTAWHAATGLAGEEIGQADTGCLKKEYRADLLVCKNDVITDPSKFQNDAILEVMKDGVAYRAGIPEIPQTNYRLQVHKLLNCASSSS